MNVIIVSGRLTHDVEVRTGEFSSAYFTLAVRSPVNKDTYFPRFSASGKTADFLGTYGKKGQCLEVTGFIKTKEKEVDGKKQTTTYLEALKIEFAPSTKSEGQSEAPAQDAPPPKQKATPVPAPVEQPKADVKTATKKTTTTKATPPPPPVISAPEQEECLVLEGDDELPF